MECVPSVIDWMENSDILIDGKQPIVLSDVKQSQSCAGIQPSVRVIQRGKRSHNVAFFFEVLSIRIIALSHVQEILSSLLPFELLLRRNFDFFQGSTSYLKVFCQLFPGNNVHFRKK